MVNVPQDWDLVQSNGAEVHINTAQFGPQREQPPLTDSKMVPEPTSAAPRSHAHLRLIK
jgi:hypothetical protein